MVKVRKYLDFLESIAINATDDVSTRIDKENANDTNKDIAEFNKKKERLKLIFTQTDPKTGDFVYNDEAIQKELATLPKTNREIIDIWLSVLGMERKVASEEKKSIDKTLRMEDMKSKMEIGDDATKKELSTKIKSLESEMAEDAKTKFDLEAELKKKQDEFHRNLLADKDRMNKTITKLNSIKPK